MPEEKRPQVETGLNLLPVMNLVTILIPLLLMTAQLVTLAVIDTTVPAITDKIITPPDPGFTLTLQITRSGMVLGGSAKEILDEPALSCSARPCQGLESYPVEALQDSLAAVKAEHPGEQAIILEPDATIPYEVLIATMDAARERAGEELFPAYTISGGAPD